MGTQDEFGFRLHPSIERFGHNEAELIKSGFLDRFSQENAGLEKYIQDMLTRVSNPFLDLYAWEYYQKEMLRPQFESSLMFRGILESLAKERNMPELLQDFEGWLKISDEIKQNYNEIDKTLPEYKNFMLKLMNVIKDKTEGSAIWLPDTIFDHQSVRNQTYKQVLDSDRSHLLGWGVYFLARTMATSGRHLENKKKLYDELKNLSIGGVPVPEKKLSVPMPIPLGFIDVQAETVFEKLAETQPSSEQLDKLHNGLRGYFRGRAKQIFNN